MLNKFNVIIIGAGQIGAFYDNPLSKYLLTYAHAFKNHSGFKLLGFVDKNIEKAKKAATIWNVGYFENLNNAFSLGTIDIVVVAVPDEFHYEIVHKALVYPIKLIFCEKPLAKNIADSYKIICEAQEKGRSLVVNYSRVFVPEFIDIKRKISSGIFGKYVGGSGYYGKGFVHNGSHAINLINFLVGQIKKLEILSIVYDFYDNDPSITAKLKFSDNKYFLLQNVDCRLYTIFELDLFFEKKRIRIINSGINIEFFDIKKDSVFVGYKIINYSCSIKTDLLNSLKYAVDNIYNYLSFGESLVCSHDTMINDLNIYSEYERLILEKKDSSLFM